MDERETLTDEDIQTQTRGESPRAETAADDVDSTDVDADDADVDADDADPDADAEDPS